MRTSQLAALALVPALALTGCVTASTSTRTWGDPSGDPAYQQEQWVRYGRVDQIRETVHRQQGNPAGGAVAGAVVGGILGSALEPRGGGLVGAIGGAMFGAAASQGAAEDRYYEVFVRFEDGGAQTFVYQGHLPFRVGDDVQLTPRGLYRG
jgi:outer membrane lipoprotein SlyB